MTKVNQQTMKTQYDGQYDTFCRKNHDYGNSFEESLDQFGIVTSIVRMSDKMKRLASLTDESKTQQVGSESLLDTLEDLSNYAAMTACWLRGIREEDGETSCGPDMIDVIKYNVQDAKNVMSRSAEMEKEFNKHIPSKVENIDPRNYILNMLSDIFRVVQMKLDKDEMLVPLDISDEAGLIAKAIVESQTEEECGAVINNYMCTRKDIPYELKDWIYGIIAHYSYYLKKERTEYGENTIYADNKPVVTYKEDTTKYEAYVTIGNDWELTDAVRDVVTMLKVVFKLHCKIEEFRMTKEDYEELDHITNRLRSMVNDGTISEGLMRKLIDIHVKLNPDVILFQLFNYRTNISSRPTDEQEAKRVALFNVDILNMAKDCLNELFDNIILCRDQNIPLPKRLTYCSYREEKYEQIAALVLTGNIDFGEVSSIVNDYPNLRVAEKNHLLQSIVSAAYKISDEPDNEKPEFLNKKFNIPDEILEDLKEPEEEPERKRTVLGMIFPFRL